MHNSYLENIIHPITHSNQQYFIPKLDKGLIRLDIKTCIFYDTVIEELRIQNCVPLYIVLNSKQNYRYRQAGLAIGEIKKNSQNKLLVEDKKCIIAKLVKNTGYYWHVCDNN